MKNSFVYLLSTESDTHRIHSEERRRNKERERERKLIPQKNQIESNVSYEKRRRKTFYWILFPRFIFQSRMRNFFAIACVIEGAYYIANYKKKAVSSCKTQDRARRRNTQKNSINISAFETWKKRRRRFLFSIFKYTSLSSWLFHAIPLDQSLIWFDYKYKKKCQITWSFDDDEELWHKSSKLWSKQHSWSDKAIPFFGGKVWQQQTFDDEGFFLFEM